MATFSACLYSFTELEYEQHRQKLHRLQPHLALYVDSEYLNSWRRKLAHYHTNRIRTFGLSSTSRVEGAHWRMKTWLRTSKVDIFTFWLLMDKHWIQQSDEYRSRSATAEVGVLISLQHPFWIAVNGKIYGYALHLARQQWARRGDEPVRSCKHVYHRSWGIPCKHRIREMLEGGEVLQPDDFDLHWWIDRTAHPTHETVILPPRIRRDPRARQQASRCHIRGVGPQGNRRIASSFERSEASLQTTASSAPRDPPPNHHRMSPQPPRALTPTTQQAPQISSTNEIGRLAITRARSVAAATLMQMALNGGEY